METGDCRRAHLLGQWAVQGGYRFPAAVFEKLSASKDVTKEHRWLFKRVVLIIDDWVLDNDHWQGPAGSLARVDEVDKGDEGESGEAFVRGADLPVGGVEAAASMAKHVLAGGLAPSSETQQLSDKELADEITKGQAWVAFTGLMRDPEKRRNRQLHRAQVVGPYVLKEYDTFSVEVREDFLRSVGPLGQLLFGDLYSRILAFQKWRRR